MIFGFSNYRLGKKDQSRKQPATEVFRPVDSKDDDRLMSKAQIFDLAHERRLRALHHYIEQGYTLSEAARLLGVSQLTVRRWHDHGRR